MNVALPSPANNWPDLIRPTMRDVATSGIVEVFNYGRGRQGLIPSVGWRGRPADAAFHQRGGQDLSRSRRDLLHLAERRP